MDARHVPGPVRCRPTLYANGSKGLDSLDLHKLYWERTWTIPNTQWTICGFSRSADRTGFYIKALDLLLDAGPQHTGRPRTIFITHTHGDHIANLPLRSSHRLAILTKHQRVYKFMDLRLHSHLSKTTLTDFSLQIK